MKNRKTIKTNKGITLIALIITIIVLLILAVVSIGAIRDGGIITHAESAKSEYQAEQEKEKVTLAVSEAILANNGGTIKKSDLVSALNKQFGEENYTISEGEEAPFKVTITNGTGTEYTIESNGNITPSSNNDTGDKETVDGVAIPTGFHHVTGDTKEVGIVVADENGNEYVWVPVTKNEDGTATVPYESTNGKMTTTKGEVEIKLQRNGFGTSITSYTEDTSASHNSSYGNAIAKDIEKFKESVSKNGGYFIGRYEAGIEEGSLVIKQGAQVWNNVTQNKASELCRNIESDYSGITSDLINSYAWDTAIVFIQTCGTNNNYANQVGKSTTSQLSNTGESILESTGQVDKQCNIYDMAGNCREMSTETSNGTIGNCVYRGGYYSGVSNSPKYRFYIGTTYSSDSHSFRPILYW